MEILDKVCELYQFNRDNDKITEQEIVKNSFPNIKIDSSEMVEKFRTADNYAVLLKLCQFLDGLNHLQLEAFKRSEQLEQYKLDNNLPTHQSIPMDDENWAILRQGYKQLLDEYGTNNLMRFSGYFSSDPTYDYIYKGCIAKILMKSNRKMMIEFFYLPYYGGDSLKFHQFTLTNADNVWLVDKFRYRYKLEDNWQTTSI